MKLAVASIQAGFASIALLAIASPNLPNLASQASVSPVSRAYAAWQTYERHDTKVNLEHLVSDSYTLAGYGNPGLVSDIAQLWADVAGGAPATYIRKDRAYIEQDFTELLLGRAS